MPREPRQRAHGGLGQRHRSSSDRHRGLFRPHEEDHEENHRDDRVRGGWLGHTAGSEFLSDMEDRVHGGSPSRPYYLTAGSDSCVRGGYPSPWYQYLTAGGSSRQSMASRAREEADSLERELHSIERSIVIPICLNPEAREFFPDSDKDTAQRLDIYLAAARRLQRLDTSGDIDKRKNVLLKTVMSCLAEEFCHLRVWRLDDAMMRTHSPASIWESSTRRCCRGSKDSRMSCSSSSGSFMGSGCTSDGSCSYHRGPGEEPSVQSYKTIAAGMIYVDPNSLLMLRDIARVMIGGGYECLLRGAFDRHCAQLARYIEILDIDSIFGYQMEEPRETVLKVWTSAMHIIISLLREMQRQLNAHDFGSFDKIKEEYFLAIGMVTVMKLLNSASSISIQVEPLIDRSCKNSYKAVKRNMSRMVDVVMVYQALDHGMPTIISLLSGKTKELIVAEGEGLIKRLLDMLAKLSVELNKTVPHRYPEAREFFPDSDRDTALHRYLTSARRLQCLDTSGDINQHKKILLKTVMSCLAEEFCHLRVWRLDDAMMRDHSPASIWESSARCCRSGSEDSRMSTSSSESVSFTASGGTSDGSCSYHKGLGEESSIQSYNMFTVGMICVDRMSLCMLRDIASVMIGGGYECVLRGAFDRHCTQLARYIEILDIDNIFGYQMEEPRETVLKVWTSTMHIIINLLREMQRQLNAHDFGSFDKIKEEYFLAIAKVTVMKLLNSASSISIQVEPVIDRSCKNSYKAVKRNMSRMVDVLMVYQTLDHGMPVIISLLSGKTKELIVADGEGLIKRLSYIFAKLSEELNKTVRSQHLFITDTGVHRFTKHVMDHIRLLVQHKRTMYPMLKNDLKSFGELVIPLIWSLEFMLNMNSRSLQLKGQEQIFLLNNVHFMLEEAEKNTELVLILGESWFLRCHDQLDQFIADYVDVSWTPVMSSLERKPQFSIILWSHQLLCKFTSAFEVTCSVQKNWKVADPRMRQKLREAISHKVLPLYRMHMECDSEKMQKSARYDIEQIESQLLEMFEG